MKRACEEKCNVTSMHPLPPRGCLAQLSSSPYGRCWGYRNGPHVAVAVAFRKVRVQGRRAEALSITQGIQRRAQEGRCLMGTPREASWRGDV